MSKEILNKYIELIDKGYCEDCNELNCLGNFPHKEIAKNIKLILEENKKYKEVIEELSKAIHEIDESRKLTGGFSSNYIDYLVNILKR